MSQKDNKDKKQPTELELLEKHVAELKADKEALTEKNEGLTLEKEKLQKENKELKESDDQHKTTIKELMEKVKAQEDKEAVSKPEFTVKGQKYRLNVTALVIDKKRLEAKEILNDKKIQEFLVKKESGAISKVK